MKKNLQSAALVLLATFAFSSTNVQAGFKVKLEANGVVVLGEVEDNDVDGNDTNSALNKIRTLLEVGGVTVDITAETDSPGFSTGSTLFNTTATIVQSSGTPGPITIWITSTGFSQPATPPQMYLNSSLGGNWRNTRTTDGDNVSFTSYVDLGDLEYGTGFAAKTISDVWNTGDANNIQQNDTTDPFAYTSGDFSITQKYVVNLQNNNPGTPLSVNGTSTVLPTPEPASLLMLGLGAAGFAGYFGVRRKKSKV